MKKIVIDLINVDVKLVKFVRQDEYADFSDNDGRSVENIASEIDEIEKLRARKPIAFFKQNDGSYIIVTQKPSDKPE